MRNVSAGLDGVYNLMSWEVLDGGRSVRIMGGQDQKRVLQDVALYIGAGASGRPWSAGQCQTICVCWRLLLKLL